MSNWPRSCKHASTRAAASLRAHPRARAGMGHVWPLSLVVQALTAADDAEVLMLLDALKTSSGGKRSRSTYAHGLRVLFM